MRRSTFAFALVLAASSYGACAGTGSDDDCGGSGRCSASSDAGPEKDVAISEGPSEQRPSLEVECGTGAVLTLAEWESCTTPRTGPHPITP